jgi:hypothetical protein
VPPASWPWPVFLPLNLSDIAASRIHPNNITSFLLDQERVRTDEGKGESLETKPSSLNKEKEGTEEDLLVALSNLTLKDKS